MLLVIDELINTCIFLFIADIISRIRVVYYFSFHLENSVFMWIL